MVVDYFDRNDAFDSLDLDFVVNLSTENHVNPCTLVVAIIYIERLKNSYHSKDFEPSELYLSALILATKLFNDAGSEEFYWNDEWASVSGFSLAKVNQLEIQLLQELDWNILVMKNVFEETFESMEKWVARDLIHRYGFTTYNELNLISSKNFPKYKENLEEFLQHFAILTAVYISSLIALIILPYAIMPVLQASIYNTTNIETKLNVPIFNNSTIVLNQGSKQIKWNISKVFRMNLEYELEFNRNFKFSIR